PRAQPGDEGAREAARRRAHARAARPRREHGEGFRSEDQGQLVPCRSRMLALTLALSLQLGAGEARPEAWVVVSRRSGVTKPQALEYARAIAQGLTERAVP